MDSPEFIRRKEVALDRVRDIAARVARQSFNSLIPVYDVRAGGSEYVRRVNDNARQNGQIDRSASGLASSLQSIITQVGQTQAEQELYNYLVQEVREIILAGSQPITKKEGGLDWSKVYQICERTRTAFDDWRNPVNSRSVKLEAAKGVYQCFWKID